jgi:hypothetical protein
MIIHIGKVDGLASVVKKKDKESAGQASNDEKTPVEPSSAPHAHHKKEEVIKV